MEVPVKWGNEQRGWHIDRTISISHVISIVVIGFGMLQAFGKLERKTEFNQQEIKHLQAIVAEIKDRQEQQRKDFREDSVRINAKLDRLIKNSH